VLDSTVYFALQRQSAWESLEPVLELLIAAGADVRAVDYPTGNQNVDDLLRRRGRAL
jgi:hypothetical protein